MDNMDNKSELFCYRISSASYLRKRIIFSFTRIYFNFKLLPYLGLSDIVFVVDAYGTFDYVHTFWFKPICESRQEYATRLLDEADITIEKIDGEWTTVVNFNHDEDNICECREED